MQHSIPPHNQTRPEAVAPKKGFNPALLIALVVSLGLVFVLSCVFISAAGLFLYQTNETTDTQTLAPTVEVVQFSQGESETEPALPIPTPTVVAESSPDNEPPSGIAETVEVVDEPPSEDPAESTTDVEPETVEEPVETVDNTTNYPVPHINEEPVTMSSPDYGMQVFLFWQEEIADRDLKLVEDADFTWVKQEFAWRDIEGASKGEFDWTRTDRIMDQIDSHGLKVIIRLGVQPQWATPNLPHPEVGPPDNIEDWADFVRAVAERYKGRIDAYQIWNEPNLSREWGERPPSPQEYTDLLKLSYETIKAIDPYAIVISAGMAPTTRNDHVAMPDLYFIQGMYDVNASPYFDALGAHGPGYKSPPETDPAEIANTPGLANPGDFENNVPEELRRVYGFRHVEDVREVMVRNGDEAKQVVLLEFGWTVDPRPDSPYHWHAVSPIEQAQYLERAYAYAKQNWQPWIGVMSLIYVANPQWTANDEQTYWSIVYPGYPELNTAPAYEGLKKMPKDD